MSFIMDFSDPNANKPPIQFTMDGDTFNAAPLCPAGALQDMAAMGQMAQSKNIGAMLDKLDSFLTMVLLPESAERFRARMRNPQKPVTQQQLTKLVGWLMQEYTGRPTEPASSSQTGQVEMPMSSTDGASLTGSPGNVWDSVTSPI